ncbi:MAG: C45 family autoproteolytic acyltransferase/hydrolase [Candidatus Heimdallarchaeota archaeon]
MTNTAFLPVFRVRGTNYEIGFEIGRKFKERIKKAFTHSVIYKYLIKIDRLKPEWFDSLHEHAKKYFPQYLTEISGIAEGAGVDYRNIALINFRGSFPEKGCSTVIFKQQDKIILAHNEDHETVLGELAYLLIVELQDGTTFLAYTYPGCLPGYSFSFNSHGIVMSANAMPDPDAQIGVPRHLLDRSMLEATNIDNAIRKALMPQRSGAFSYNLVSWKEKRVLNLEITSKRHYVTEIQDKYFHANHFISDELKGSPVPSGTTQRRYERGVELISCTSHKSLNEARKILFDNNIFLPRQERVRTLYGNYFGGTLCTALFEIGKDIILQVYPPKQSKKQFFQFSLSTIT